MTPITNRIATLAAAAVVLSTMAFGQTKTMKAEIPFAFSTPSGTLPAGAYIVTDESRNNDSHIAALHNANSKKVVLVLGTQKDYYKKGDSAILFRCGDKGCALSGIRTADGTVSYNAPRQSKHDKEVALVAVPVQSVKAD